MKIPLHKEIENLLMKAGEQHGFKSKRDYIGPISKVDVAWLYPIEKTPFLPPPPFAIFEVVVSETQKPFRAEVIGLLSIPAYLRVVVIPFEKNLRRFKVEGWTEKDLKWYDTTFRNYVYKTVKRFPEIRLWEDKELRRVTSKDWIIDQVAEFYKG